MMSFRASWMFIAAAVAWTTFPAPAQAQGGRYGLCDGLRYECRNKDRLGLRGEGACRRMRAVCENDDDDDDRRRGRRGRGYSYGEDCRTVLERGFTRNGERVVVRRRVCD